MFRAYLRYLSSGGWRVISADTFLKGLSVPERLPERAVLLTFVDAYKSLLGSASLCLQEFAYPAIVFTATKFVGRSNDFDRAFNQPEESICGWNDLRELKKRGFSIQSHGVTHGSFRGLAPEQQEQELLQSKNRIEAEIGEPVELFAYPFGDVPDSTHPLEKLLKRLGYQAAFLFRGSIRTIARDRYFLPRVDMYSGTDLASSLASHFVRRSSAALPT
jgi:peptidoglycan/xylan/chitin deacetylase (PgdA/CDA1 family)